MMISAVTKRHVGLGIKVGVVLATVFSAWVLYNHSVAGSRAIESSGATVSGLLLAYYSAGVVGGALVGMLVPLARRPGGTILVGCVTAVIVLFAVQTARKGPFWNWDRRTVLQTTLLGVAFGAICGPWIAHDLRR